ncbi:DUF2059 domain-containing protein [Maricaulis sp.]|uniref:DUF2059 domain-containing protein n=1 Tax=Maricaulis sp. TaxID=1486257 RepID=UPI0025BFD8A4|nr:DUF2059 domain-containing protein [Maricaulis sp.]
MTRFLIGALSAVFLIVSLPPVEAQDADATRRVELARQIVEASTSEDVYRIALETSLPLARQNFAVSIPGATDAQLDEAMDIMLEIMMSTYPDVVEVSSNVYASRFTEAELVEILAFYQTPVGRKLASEMPGITGELAQIGEMLGGQAVQNNIGRLQAIFQ